jgi:hypothetical protein
VVVAKRHLRVRAVRSIAGRQTGSSENGPNEMLQQLLPRGCSVAGPARFARQRAEACACRRGHVTYNHLRLAVNTRGVLTCWIRRRSSIGRFRTLPASPAHQLLHKCGYLVCVYALACSQWLSMDLLPLHGGAQSSSGDPVGRRVYLTSRSVHWHAHARAHATHSSMVERTWAPSSLHSESGMVRE